MQPESECPPPASAILPNLLANLPASIFDGMQAGLFIVDPGFRIMLANKSIQDQMKRSAVEMSGMHCYRLFHDREAVCPDCAAAITFRTGESSRAAHRVSDEEGRPFYTEVTTHAIKDDRGEVAYVFNYLRDISERVRFEEENASLTQALKEAEEKYRTVVEHSNDVIWILDRVGNFVWFNSRAEEIGGYKLDDWRGKSFAPLIVPDDLPKVAQVFAETLAGRPQSYEVRVYGSDGKVFHALVNTAPILSNGEVVGSVSFGRDITDRKQAEEERIKLAQEQAARAEAEAAQRRIAGILESITDAFFALDHRWRFTYVNREAERFLRRTRDELLGKDLRFELPGVFALLPRDEIEEAPAKRTAMSFEIHYAPFDQWFEVRIFPSEEGLSVYFRDVSERRRAEEALRESEERLRAFIDNANAIIYLKDIEGRYILVNRHFRERYQALRGVAITTEGFVGKTDYDFFPEEIASVFVANDRKVLAAGTPLEFEEADHFEAGSRHYLSVKFPLRDSGGAICGICGISTDITQRKQIEQFREEYVSLISHDLRAPLTIIQGQAQLLQRILQRAGLIGQKQRSVDAITSAAQRMNAMIQDLVESARLEGGQLEMRRELTDLRQLVSDIFERDCSPEDRARLRLEALDQVPLVAVDAEHIERAIVNLVFNALKYSPPDTPVVLQIGRRDSEAVISVIDQGVGISPEDLPRLFQRFYRAKTGKKTEGLGLGLYISRLIVEAHGGRIWATSEVRHGSTFSFTLPLA